MKNGILQPFSIVSITEGFAPMWCQCSNFFRKVPFTFALFLKVSKSELWEYISKSITSGDGGALVVVAILVWLEVRLLALIIGGEERVLYGKLDLLDIPKPMIKCCRWYCRINVVVTIWLSGVLFFPTRPWVRCPKFPFVVKITSDTVW